MAWGLVSDNAQGNLQILRSGLYINPTFVEWLVLVECLVVGVLADGTVCAYCEDSEDFVDTQSACHDMLTYDVVCHWKRLTIQNFA